ncbi:2ea66175-221d-46ae-b452-cecf5687328e [Sclerotinia trifoliorum]|uniref:2ea66175-221d-46ae-b452-cecf5687328e n=1 Tax=Sclerotinia trifoliorum TaxID=28548 RepID=A0A8H2VW96_9HELO|nr:2ea66175-221d-46ae-b452-cecf5687328e [Sclerotinia trifoliorum]
MDTYLEPRPHDDNPDITTDNNESNHNGSIFGIPNMFNSANFAQASILSNDAERTINSPDLAYRGIFSDTPRSINNSPVSAQTNIFSGGQNSNLTSPVTAQTSIFGDVSNSNSTSQTPAQVYNSPNAPNRTITTTDTIQSVTRIQEVDPFAHGSEPDSEPGSDPDINPDIEPYDNPDLEITSDVSSRSISSSPEAPDFDAPAAPAPETLSLSSDHSSLPIFKCNMPRTFAGFGVMFNSAKRSAAIKGQAQRIGAVGADKDDSGTYDPSLERKRNVRNTRAKKNKENVGEEETAKIAVGTRNGRKTKELASFEWVITIKLTSEKGLKYLKEITPGPEGDERNFPPIYEADYVDSGDGNENENEDDEIDYSIHSTRRKKAKTSHNRRSDGLTLEELHDGNPQRRGCKACFDAGDDECSLIEYSHEWPCEGCEDAGIDCELIIPPELKLSCIRCKEMLRKKCSYADDGGKGVKSCKACEEANVKCIAGPRADSAPSMRISDVLANAGTKRKGSKSTKAEGIKKGREIATATSVAKPQALPRKYVSCNRCRVEFRGRCSLKRDDEGPCNRCVKANVACTFTMLPSIPGTPKKEKGKEKGKGTEKDMAPVSRTPQDLTQTIILESTKLNDRVWRTTDPHTRRTKAQQKAFSRAQSSCSPEIHFLSSNPINHANSQKPQTNTKSYIPNNPAQQTITIPSSFTLQHKGIRTITIKTSFSHPLIFNYKRDPMSLHPCDFHTTPFFGLFGYGPRLVTVVPWPRITGAGYEELENGWGDSDVGHDATRMCVKCTYARVKILGCAEHELRPIEGLDERMRDEGGGG